MVETPEKNTYIDLLLNEPPVLFRFLVAGADTREQCLARLREVLLDYAATSDGQADMILDLAGAPRWAYLRNIPYEIFHAHGVIVRDTIIPDLILDPSEEIKNKEENP